MPAAPASDRLLGAGLIHDKGPWSGQRTLDCWAVVYLLNGRGWFASGGDARREVHAGDALLLFPGLSHGYGPFNAGEWAEGWIMAGGPSWPRLEAEAVIDRADPLLHAGSDPALAEAFAALAHDHARAGEHDRAWLAARALALVTDLARRHRLSAQRRRGTTFIVEACARLAEDLDQPLDLDRLAARHGLSLERFRKVFAAEVGMPPARFRLQKRIARAQALLVEGRLGLAEIAESLGFCDEYQFNRMFRQHTGTSPGRFRRGGERRPESTRVDR